MYVQKKHETVDRPCRSLLPLLLIYMKVRRHIEVEREINRMDVLFLLSFLVDSFILHCFLHASIGRRSSKAGGSEEKSEQKGKEETERQRERKIDPAIDTTRSLFFLLLLSPFSRSQLPSSSFFISSQSLSKSSSFQSHSQRESTSSLFAPSLSSVDDLFLFSRLQLQIDLDLLLI